MPLKQFCLDTFCSVKHSIYPRALPRRSRHRAESGCGWGLFSVLVFCFGIRILCSMACVRPLCSEARVSVSVFSFCAVLAPELGSKMVPGLPKSVQKLPQEVPKSIKMVPKWTPEGQDGVERATPGLRQRSGSILEVSRAKSLIVFGGQNGLKSIKKSIEKNIVF